MVLLRNANWSCNVCSVPAMQMLTKCDVDLQIITCWEHVLDWLSLDLHRLWHNRQGIRSHDWRRGPGRCRSAASTAKQRRAVRSAAITKQAGDWIAGSCTASTSPEYKPFVFGVIPEFVYCAPSPAALGTSSLCNTDLDLTRAQQNRSCSEDGGVGTQAKFAHGFP